MKHPFILGRRVTHVSHLRGSSTRGVGCRLVTTALGCLIVTLLGLAVRPLPAAEPGPSIGRLGHALIITAPTGTDLSSLGPALDQRLTLDFSDTPVNEALDAIRTMTGVDVITAPEAAVTTGTLTLKAEGMSLGHVLAWMHTLTGLYFAGIHGAIYVSAAPEAGPSETRLYDISALTMDVPDFKGMDLAYTASGAGSGGGQADIFATPPADQGHGGAGASADDIIRLITSTIGPGTWQPGK